jgi:hypoxanthine phosphoribosyltransferase
MTKQIEQFLGHKYPKLTPNPSAIGYYDIDDNTGKTLAHISKELTPRYDNHLHIHLSQMDELMSWFSIDKKTSRKYIQNYIHKFFNTQTVDELRSKFNNTPN